MTEFKPVSIPSGAYVFCRFTVALIYVFAFFIRSKELVLAGFIILTLSALLKVRRAPLIWIYTNSVDKLIPTRKQIIDEKGIRFAHSFGAAVSLFALMFLYFGNAFVGWATTLLMAILQTLAAFGFCSAYKLYTCVSSGGDCCNIGKRIRKIKHV